MPIISLSQLVGRAIGVCHAQLGLKKHMVDVTGRWRQAAPDADAAVRFQPAGISSPLEHVMIDKQTTCGADARWSFLPCGRPARTILWAPLLTFISRLA